MRRAYGHPSGGEHATHDPSVTRTEAYTDAVFAIAATLLVLDLTTSSLGDVHSDGELWVPPSEALRDPRLPASGETLRLAGLYRRKGLGAVVQTLRAMR